MKFVMSLPMGEMKIRMENVLPPKKYMKRFRKEQEIVTKITENLKRGKQ